jgi:hypothetical protein
MEPVAAIATAAGWGLAITFLVAAATKFRSRRTSVADLRRLGVPAPRAVAAALPPVELGVAAALVLAPGVGGWAALGLLAAFTAVLARAHIRGVSGSCACFGAASEAPLGRLVFVRNGLLAAVALAAGLVADAGWPGIDAVIAASAGWLVAGLGLALARMQEQVGAVWAVHLPDRQEGIVA